MTKRPVFVPLGRLNELRESPNADRMAYTMQDGVFGQAMVSTYPSRKAMLVFCKDGSKHHALIKTPIHPTMLGNRNTQRPDDAYTVNPRDADERAGDREDRAFKRRKKKYDADRASGKIKPTEEEVAWEEWNQAQRRKHGTSVNPPKVFTVGVTYQIVTEESADKGSDAEERGWESEPKPMTLRDALDTISKYGPYDHEQDGFDDVMFYGYGEMNYRTGEEITYDVVVRGSEKDLWRLMAFYDKRNK